MNSPLLEYYRNPETCAQFSVIGPVSDRAGYFRWGQDTICYGRSSSGVPAGSTRENLHDVTHQVDIRDGHVFLPFDPDEVIRNLRLERYASHFRGSGSVPHAITRKIYYALRPYLSVPVRKHLQRLRLRGWKTLSFPEWPVDCTVDRIHRRLLALAMKAAQLDTMPFIWFWPDGLQSCAIITHDVETARGRDYCDRLMDIDASFGFSSSFQVVPEKRYSVPESYLSQIVRRGFEVNIHDLNHDGRLYEERGEFLRRAKKINEYAVKFNTSGFRSAILYRNPDWYDVFSFEYDMSIPNVAHLDPQRGGCCTLMPYFIGNLVELPLTCIQDYSLFQMLNEYSTAIWKKQVDAISANHGLITILTHPDYLIESRAQECYRDLLEYLSELRDKSKVWAALPREVAGWWRQRSQQKLARQGTTWAVDGPGSDRARVAYARLDGDSVTYSFCP